MKKLEITIEYSNLKITIQSTALTTDIDAITCSSAIFQTMKKEGYGNPKLSMKETEAKDNE